MAENKLMQTENTDARDQDSSTQKPPVHPQNLVTPVAVHETWEDIYAQNDDEEADQLEYKESKDGRVVLSKDSLEIVKKKLDAAKRMKNRHVKILKLHEELVKEHDELLKQTKNAPEPIPLPLPPASAQEQILKGTKRIRKITQALAACSWHQQRRKVKLTREMIKTLRYIDKTVTRSDA